MATLDRMTKFFWVVPKFIWAEWKKIHQLWWLKVGDQKVLLTNPVVTKFVFDHQSYDNKNLVLVTMHNKGNSSIKKIFIV
jgi:hypothetical protein